MNGDGLIYGRTALGALTAVAFAVAVGSMLCERWLAAEGGLMPNASSHPAWSRSRASLIAAAFALLLADAGWLLYQSAAMGGVGLGAALAVMPDVIGKTHVGHAWSIAFGGAALLLVGALLYRGGQLGQIVLWAAAIVHAAGAGTLGHAADAGLVSLAAGEQLAHSLSTAVWGGVVLAGGFIVLPALDTSTTRTALIRLAEHISRASLIAFCVVLATGIAGALRGLDNDLAALRSSVWGHVLTLKLALVLLALVLAVLNRTSVLPRLRRTASTMDAHTFCNIVHLEAFVMVGVFVVAAALVQCPPPYTGP